MKLVEVMACVDRVSKNGNNTTQNYKYAMAADVYDAVRSEMAKRFVLLVPHLEKTEFADKPTKSGGTMTYCTVHVRFEFVDSETGEVLPVLTVGQGSDTGDKSVYKAMTGATKQCLIQTFLIPTGDDPEHEKASKPTPPPPAGADALKSRMKTPPPAGAPATHDRSLAYPFGNDKGKPISEVDDKSIAFWIGRIQTELNDPSKAKWHDKERARLVVLQAEQRYRSSSASPPADDGPPPLTDEDSPY